MTNISVISTYLDIDINRNLDAKTFTISEFKYVRKILVDYDLKNYSSVNIPIDPSSVTVG